MKKYLVSTLTLLAVLGGSVSPAFADNGSGIRDLLKRFRTDRKEDLKEFKDERRDDRASVSAALRLKVEADRTEKREERLMKFWRKTGERLQRLINRETKMADKIGKRLERLEDAGKNVSAQKALLATARLKIADAQTALNSATTELKKMIDDEKPMTEIIAKARVLHKGVVAKIRVAHKSLVDVVISIRGISATPTPTPTP